MKSETKYLGLVVFVEGVKPDSKAVAKLRDWENPRNETEMQSFLRFANYYREYPWHARLVAIYACHQWSECHFRMGV